MQTAPTPPATPHVSAAWDQLTHQTTRVQKLKAELDKATRAQSAARDNLRTVERMHPQEAALFVSYHYEVAGIKSAPVDRTQS